MRIVLIILSFILGSCAYSQEVPAVMKTELSKSALAQKITNSQGKKITISDVLKKHKGEVVVIDFWASWCRDCINALPQTTKLKEEIPNVKFIYFSLDRSKEQWGKGLEKFNLKNNENYWFDEGWENNFNNYIELNWIPRFMVIDQKGKIAHYYSISPQDEEMKSVLKSLLKTE